MAKANSEALVKFPANFVGKKDAQDFVKNVLAGKYDGLLTKLKKYDSGFREPDPEPEGFKLNLPNPFA